MLPAAKDSGCQRLKEKDLRSLQEKFPDPPLHRLANSVLFKHENPIDAIQQPEPFSNELTLIISNFMVTYHEEIKQQLKYFPAIGSRNPY